MVDPKILEECGVTVNRLRQIHTATEGDDAELRKKTQKRIQARIYQGMLHNLRTRDMFQAVDMAWDSQPIQKEMIPLMLYAMGRIKKHDCYSQVKKVTDAVEQFCDWEVDEKGKKTEKLKDMHRPRLYETPINLIRSYITRRVAAQADRFDIFPYLQYEPRGVDPVAKIKGDALSQRVEIMADQFGYRHQGNQLRRETLMYAQSVLFPTCRWVRDVQWRRKDLGEDFDPKHDADGKLRNVETVVEREGLEFTAPHPTRVFWDNSAPLANVNVPGSGPDWVGYWDIQRYGDVLSQDMYWNAEAIGFSQQLAGLFHEHLPFFQFYFDPCVLKLPQIDVGSAVNDREANIGIYASGDEEDMGVFLTQYFERIIPKDHGIGTYPYPVWFRYVVASDDTVVYAEPLTTSIAAIYEGYNVNDSRQANISMAHELMALQDQMQNILSQMLLNLKASLFKIWLINKDALDEPTQQYMEKVSKSSEFYVQPHIAWFSGIKDRDESGIDYDNIIKIIESSASADIAQSFAAIEKLMNLADRLLLISPNEAAQVAPREVTANEVVQVANTTNAMYNYISSGVNESRAAMKMMIYEALITCSTEPIRVPVLQRYSPAVVKEAGFEIEGAESIGDDPRKRHLVIVGNVKNLDYEYNFNSRDGQQRPSKTMEAQVLMQILAPILGNERLSNRIGEDKITEWLNLMFRNLGFDLKLDDPEDAEPGMEQPMDEQGLAQQVAANTQVLQQVLQALGVGGSGGGPQGPTNGAPPPGGGMTPPRPSGGAQRMSAPELPRGITNGPPRSAEEVPRPAVPPMPANVQ